MKKQVSLADLHSVIGASTFIYGRNKDVFFDFIENPELSIKIGDTDSLYSDGEYVFLKFEDKPIIKWEAEYFKATYLNIDRLGEKMRYDDRNNVLRVFLEEAELVQKN